MIYAGFTFAPIPNWVEVMPIKAPSNYKKAEAIEKYVEERKVVLAGGEAAVNQLTGTVTYIAYREGEDGKIKRLAPDEGVNFLFTAMAETRKERPVIGYKIHRALKLLCLQSALVGGTPVPVEYFKHIDDVYNRPGGLIDPVSLLFGTSETDLFAVAARCGTTVNPDDPGALVEFAQVLMRNVDIGE